MGIQTMVIKNAIELLEVMFTHLRCRIITQTTSDKLLCITSTYSNFKITFDTDFIY